jgi:hypothetical protein
MTKARFAPTPGKYDQQVLAALVPAGVPVATVAKRATAPEAPLAWTTTRNALSRLAARGLAEMEQRQAQGQKWEREFWRRNEKKENPSCAAGKNMESIS